MIRRVVPFLDQFSPRQVVFREALEWASRLHLPIHALSLGVGTVFRADGDLIACEETCSRLGVSWRATHFSQDEITTVPDSLRPDDLLLLPQRPGSVENEFLFRSAAGRLGPAVAVCPARFTPISRMLYVHSDDAPAETTLGSVVELCRALEAPLVVLSLAGSERDAWRLQRAAEETLASYRYPAEFDFLIGWDLRKAVGRVAGWRHCSHVILERQSASAWWRRLDSFSDPLTFLTLPAVESATPIGTLIAKS
jgi:hypothetical protein